MISEEKNPQNNFKLASGVEEFFLENGLQVLLKPNPDSSAVSTWIFYKVGSRNERPGITGASHWCEHMLFKGGGKLRKGDVHALVSAEGGRNNAFTDHDLTAYFETLSKSKLDLGLFIESERMANSEFNPMEVERERQVIISEREGSENYPTYQLREEIYAMAYRVHPYRWPVVGWKSDLKRMTRNDLYTHYKSFYHPNNSILVLTGNFDVGEATSKIRSMFGQIHEGETVLRKILFEEPVQIGERRGKIVQKGTTNYLGVAFHLPEITHNDIPSLVVLASVLGGWGGLIGIFGDRYVPKVNRLYKKLVQGRIASEVNTYFPVSADPGLLYFELTMFPGVSAKKAESKLISELERISDSPPTDLELNIAFNSIRASHAFENDGIASQALALGFMQTLGNRNLADEIVAKSLLTTTDDVQRAAKKYLLEENRVVCEILSNPME